MACVARAQVAHAGQRLLPYPTLTWVSDVLRRGAGARAAGPGADRVHVRPGRVHGRHPGRAARARLQHRAPTPGELQLLTPAPPLPAAQRSPFQEVQLCTTSGRTQGASGSESARRGCVCSVVQVVPECAALPRTQHARSPHVSGTTCSCLTPCVIMSLHPLSAAFLIMDFAASELPLPFGPALCGADAPRQAFSAHS
jgi:hypothetical protein